MQTGRCDVVPLQLVPGKPFPVHAEIGAITKTELRDWAGLQVETQIGKLPARVRRPQIAAPRLGNIVGLRDLERGQGAGIKVSSSKTCAETCAGTRAVIGRGTCNVSRSKTRQFEIVVQLVG